MPQIGKSKKESLKSRGERPSAAPQKEEAEKKKKAVPEGEEIVSAYSEEGQRRIAEGKERERKREKTTMIVFIVIGVAAIVVFLIGLFTNWFQGA